MNLEQPRGFYDGQDMLAHLAHRSAPSAPPHQPRRCAVIVGKQRSGHRSEEHTSELQSLMRISYAVFCLKKKTENKTRMLRQTYTESRKSIKQNTYFNNSIVQINIYKNTKKII